MGREVIIRGELWLKIRRVVSDTRPKKFRFYENASQGRNTSANEIEHPSKHPSTMLLLSSPTFHSHLYDKTTRLALSWNHSSDALADST